jgi:predicted  nucleic acid-binding Zn-ribbon protein
MDRRRESFSANLIVNELMRVLLELQSLEFDETIKPHTEERIAALRAKIPKPVLSHYDRLCDQGKKGVARLHHQTCTGCHLRVPLAVEIIAKIGEEICLCDNCGRYLYLPENAGEEEAALTPKKIAPKSERKLPVHAL